MTSLQPYGKGYTWISHEDEKFAQDVFSIRHTFFGKENLGKLRKELYDTYRISPGHSDLVEVASHVYERDTQAKKEEYTAARHEKNGSKWWGIVRSNLGRLNDAVKKHFHGSEHEGLREVQEHFSHDMASYLGDVPVHGVDKGARLLKGEDPLERGIYTKYTPAELSRYIVNTRF